jgi:hypothetical protein
MALVLSGITTATTRSLTVPDSDGTIALLGLAQTFSALQTFSASIRLSHTSKLYIRNNADSDDLDMLSTGASDDRLMLGNDSSFVQMGPAQGIYVDASEIRHNHVTKFIGSGKTLQYLNAAATDYRGLISAGTSDEVTLGDTASSGVLTLVSSGVRGRAALVGDGASASSTQMAKVDLLNQSASVATTTIVSTAKAGMYSIEVYAVGTTTSTSATVAVTVGWTDEFGGQTFNCVGLNGTTFPLVVTAGVDSHARGVVNVAAGTNITFTATVSGTIGFGEYSLHIRVVYLG